jgi:hypothetical protein
MKHGFDAPLRITNVTNRYRFGRFSAPPVAALAMFLTGDGRGLRWRIPMVVGTRRGGCALSPRAGYIDPEQIPMEA